MIDQRRAAANIAIIWRLIEAVNRRDAFTVAGLFSMEAVNDGRRVGRDGMRRIFKNLFATFPDLRFDLCETLAHEDTVVCRTIMSGTHRGTPDLPILGGLLVGVPPTGKTVKVQHVYLYHTVNGEILEHDAVRDDLGMMQQLGLLPATSHPS